MNIWIYLNISWCILLYLTFFWICLRYLRWTLYKIDCVYFSGMAGAFFWNPSPGRGSWLPNWFCREPLIEGFSMILVFYFVVGSHFGFLRLLFCSEFGGTLLDGLVFCREPFSTKSPVSTLAWNEQGDPFVRACNPCNPPILPCPGKAKLGEDHPDTLRSLNNMALLLKAQGHLEEAKPLYREALEKSPGAQLQRFQRNFGQWIWSHTFLDIRYLGLSWQELAQQYLQQQPHTVRNYVRGYRWLKHFSCEKGGRKVMVPGGTHLHLI